MRHPMPSMASSDESALVDNGLELLTTDQCIALLGTSHLGRVGVTVGALPAIFPVNYSVADGWIYFRTADGTKLSAASARTVVAFEVDHADPIAHTGWSVLVVGCSELVEAEDEKHLQPPPPPVAAWAPGRRSQLVRVAIDTVSGRRIRHDLAFQAEEWT
jgi:hypothetical protein